MDDPLLDRSTTTEPVEQRDAEREVGVTIVEIDDTRTRDVERAGRQGVVAEPRQRHRDRGPCGARGLGPRHRPQHRGAHRRIGDNSPGRTQARRVGGRRGTPGEVGAAATRDDETDTQCNRGARAPRHPHPHPRPSVALTPAQNGTATGVRIVTQSDHRHGKAGVGGARSWVRTRKGRPGGRP